MQGKCSPNIAWIPSFSLQTSSKRFQNIAKKYEHGPQNKLNSFSVEQHAK